MLIGGGILPSNTEHVQSNMFKLLLLVTILSSLFFFVQNIIYHAPILNLLIWLSNIFFSLCVSYLFYQKKSTLHLHTVFFVYIVFIGFPLGWLAAALNSHIEIAYIFIILISVCFFYSGQQRFLLIVSIIVIDVALIMYQLLNPEKFNDPTQLQSIILITTHLPMLLGLAGYMLSTFSDSLTTKNALLEKLSHHDALTGLYNRHYIYQYLEHIKRSSHKNNPTLIGLIDVDDFKQINDLHGHQAGDQILKQIASHIKTSLQQTAVVGRYGGDEFIIIIKNSHLVNYEQLFDTLSLTYVSDATLSGGCAIFTGEEDLDQILALADKRLYQAKRSGKNKILLSY